MARIINNVQQLIGSTAPVQELSSPTVREVALLYGEEMDRKRLRPYTIRHELDCLKGTLVAFGDVPINTITTEMLEQKVFDPLRQAGRKSNTINGRVKAVRRLFAFAVKRQFIFFNPAWGVVKVRHIQEEIQSLADSQVIALLKQPDLDKFTGYRDFTVIKMMLDTGIRLRECMDLTVGQVDLDGRVIRGVLGKNGSTDDIPLSRTMCKTLQLYLRLRNGAPEGCLFINIDGGPYNRRTFQERLKEYGRRAKIVDVRVSPHTLRHTFAKHWILNGGDVFSLQKILRHSTMDMVKRYVTLWGTEVQQQHDKFSPTIKWETVSNAGVRHE